MKTWMLLALLAVIAVLMALLTRTDEREIGSPVIEVVRETCEPAKHAEHELSAPESTISADRRSASGPVASNPSLGWAEVGETPAAEAVDAMTTPRRILGIVTSFPDGQRIQGAELRAERPVTGGQPMTARSDPYGRFTLDVGVGGLRVTCSAPGYLLWTRTVDLKSDDLTLDIALVPTPPIAAVTIHLCGPDGRWLLDSLDGADLALAASLRPVFVAVPVARGALLPKKGMLASKATAAHRGGTDVWFRATVPASAEGSCCLMLGDRVLEVAPFSAFSTDILLVTSKDALHGADGSLRLSVVDDATGRPYAGAHVRVQIAGGPKLSAVADADGSVILEHVLEGEAQVRITSFDPDRVDKPRAYVDDAPGVGEAPRVGEARRAVIVHAGRETDLGRIALARTVKISGHIERTPDGKRATGVMLSISTLRLEPDGSISPISELAVVQPDGSFEFVGANPGTYFVSATFPPSNTREPIEVASSTVDARFGDVSGAILVVNPAAALVPSVSPSAFDYLRSHDR